MTIEIKTKEEALSALTAVLNFVERRGQQPARAPEVNTAENWNEADAFTTHAAPHLARLQVACERLRIPYFFSAVVGAEKGGVSAVTWYEDRGRFLDRGIQASAVIRAHASIRGTTTGIARALVRKECEALLRAETEKTAK